MFVGRKPEPERKAALLDALVDYLCRAGIGDVSLRPLAKALGVSTYVLIYHFGSREGLLAEALESVEQRQRSMIAAWAEAEPAAGTADLVERWWQWCSDPQHLPLMRLTIEATALEGTRSGLPGALRARLVSEWVDLLAGALRAEGRTAAQARAEATLLNASLVGLALDLSATGDRRRVQAAARVLIRTLRA